MVLTRQRFRSAMLLFSVAIGVASVVILVALGEGARQYVLGEFSFIGKDSLVIFPGRKTTTGAMPPISGASARDITLQEVMLLERNVTCLLYTSDAADERSSVDLGGRRIIKKKTT